MSESTPERARWRVLYDLLTATPTDDVLAYGEMADALHLHPVGDRSAIQKALRRAAAHHLEHDSRAVEPVPNQGYRVVRAEEQIRLGHQIQTRVTNAVDKGHVTVTHVDVNGMAPEYQAQLEVMRHHFGMQAEFNRRLVARQVRNEGDIQTIMQRQDGLELDKDELLERLREQDERLRRVEGQADGGQTDAGPTDEGQAEEDTGDEAQGP